jgi:hypothetical protein
VTELKNLCDGLSITTVIATFAGWLPNIAALFTVIWTVLRVYEMKTVQDWLVNRKKPQ